MKVLIIDAEAEARAKQVKAYALVHPQNVAMLVRTLGNPKLAVGNDPNFNMVLLPDWRVVYSIEQQPDPVGWCEHISVSMNDKGKWLMPPWGVCKSMIFPLFDLKRENLLKVWAQEDPDTGEQAGNALFKYHGPTP